MTSLQALIGFTAWTLLLVLIIFSWRGIEIMLRGKKADAWTRGQASEGPALIRRIEHAHANCLENLPLFAVIVLAAAAMHKSAVTDQWAMYVLYARVAQSVTHMIGVNHWLVLLRATFWSVQLALFVVMLFGLCCGGHAA
ncbi:MAG: MAPEG family protein [Nevskia sp.]|nr:MAPEG family protein [Nevskia sp.]